MERSLHPDLVKQIVRHKQASGADRLDQMSAMTLVQGTRPGGGTQTPVERRRKDVTILDQYEHAASVKIVASDRVDYLQVAKWNSAWVIVNVLWELHPTNDS